MCIKKQTKKNQKQNKIEKPNTIQQTHFFCENSSFLNQTVSMHNLHKTISHLDKPCDMVFNTGTEDLIAVLC